MQLRIPRLLHGEIQYLNVDVTPEQIDEISKLFTLIGDRLDWNCAYSNEDDSRRYEEGEAQEKKLKELKLLD